MSSIYVAVPSISDDEFIKTLQRCLEKSSGAHEIHIGAIGIFYEDEYEYIEQFIKFCMTHNNIQFKILDRKTNVGVGIARREAFSFYKNEDFYLQIDSHTIFLQNWDSILINNLEKLKKYTNLQRVALSGYPPEYKYINTNEIYCHNGWGSQSVSVFTEGSLIKKTNHGYGCSGCDQWAGLPLWEEVKVFDNLKKYISNPKISANYLFADSEFAKDYLKLLVWDFSFFDEELVMSIEAYSLGWRFYAINDIVPLAHLYAEDMNEFSGKRSCLLEEDILELNTKNKYLDYCLNPDNRDKIEKFEKYANVKIIELAESESRKVENRTAILSQRLEQCEGS